MSSCTIDFKFTPNIGPQFYHPLLAGKKCYQLCRGGIEVAPVGVGLRDRQRGRRRDPGRLAVPPQVDPAQPAALQRLADQLEASLPVEQLHERGVLGVVGDRPGAPPAARGGSRGSRRAAVLQLCVGEHDVARAVEGQGRGGGSVEPPISIQQSSTITTVVSMRL